MEQKKDELEINENDEFLTAVPDDVDLQEFSLEDILREFGADLSDETAETEPEPEAEPTEEPEAEAEPEPEQPQEAPPVSVPAEETIRMEPVTAEPTRRLDNLGDTVRLDDVHQAVKTAETPDAEEQPAEETQEPAAEPFSNEWEPDYEAPIGDYVPPEPIMFRPRSRLRELKRQLVAGPEKRYYELSEEGVGKLQAGILLNLVVVLLAVGSTVMYGLGMVPEGRMKLLIFGQVLAMLLSGLIGCYRLIDGATDLFKGKFTLNTMLLFTFLACCADGVFCLLNQKVPCCAAFSLEMTMCLWSTYQKRVAEMGQMDTLRKAVQLDGLVKTPGFYENRPGILRRECQLDDFMEVNAQTPGPEKTMQMYALAAMAVSVGIGVTAGILHGLVLGVRAFAAAMLVAVPATGFITFSRPQALLERRLHKLGTVLCGWRGVRELSQSVTFPLGDQELFPQGSTKMNGVKFYGSRDPDEVVAYATALINADGGGLAPLFEQLLESRNGYHYEVENLQCYGNGGIGGEINGEPVLVGVLSFMQDMGVDMPEGTRVNQAVYAAIDGVLSGVFAITYGKVKSSAAGVSTLCSYRGLTPVLTSGDFMLTESFLRSKFSVNTRRVAFPPRPDRAVLAAKEPEEELPVLAMMTKEGLAGAAYAVTGARALRTVSVLGLLIHMIGGILGLVMMLALAILGAQELLSPVNLLLYELLWMIPGLLITEWTRSI